NSTGTENLEEDNTSKSNSFAGLIFVFIGCGFGAAFLTLVTRHAWERPEQLPVRRAWLRTSSGDHPHAVANQLTWGGQDFRESNHAQLRERTRAGLPCSATQERSWKPMRYTAAGDPNQ